jgi:hydrogenase maturation protease
VSDPKILVAGIGNIFFADDGFGVEVARRLSRIELPPGVTVTDYGIRSLHLAYDMLAGYDTTVLVDAMQRGDEPGTVYVVDVTAGGAGHPKRPDLDPHGMTPDAVLALIATLGGEPGQVFLVGCEPETTTERIGLSPVVVAAIDTAMDAVRELMVKPKVKELT